MFIGQQENIEFRRGRPTGSKDKTPRQRRGVGLPSAAQAKDNLRKNFAGNLARGVAGAAVIGVGLRNRKAIGSLAQKGVKKVGDTARSATQRARVSATGVKGGMRSASPNTPANKVKEIVSNTRRRANQIKTGQRKLGE